MVAKIGIVGDMDGSVTCAVLQAQKDGLIERQFDLVDLNRVGGGIQTGGIRTHMTQSQAGLGAQGPVVTESHSKPIPAPTHPDMPDA